MDKKPVFEVVRWSTSSPGPIEKAIAFLMKSGEVRQVDDKTVEYIIEKYNKFSEIKLKMPSLDEERIYYCYYNEHPSSGYRSDFFLGLRKHEIVTEITERDTDETPTTEVVIFF